MAINVPCSIDSIVRVPLPNGFEMGTSVEFKLPHMEFKSFQVVSGFHKLYHLPGDSGSHELEIILGQLALAK